MKKYRFGVDIDGTVTSPATFIPHINKHFNKNLTLDDITEYELSAAAGIAKEDFWKWMHVNEQEIYETSELAIDAKLILSQWKESHELYYISARPADYTEITIDWFNRFQVPYDHIELIGKHNKLETVKNHKIDLFFEDKHDNACTIAEDCGIPVILMDTPYNQDPLHSFVYRVNNWLEAKEVAESLMGNTIGKRQIDVFSGK